jgi:hypothetical protein
VFFALQIVARQKMILGFANCSKEQKINFSSFTNSSKEQKNNFSGFANSSKG